MKSGGGSTSFGMADKIRFHPSIPQELADAICRYDDISPTLGNRLRAAFRTAFANIAENPQLYSVLYDDIRIVRTKPFPYLVHYRLTDNVPHVVAIFHSAAHPDWRQKITRNR